MEFEKELIRRFFNARSYFFLCLSERLREELPLDSPGSEEQYALVAALLERLQGAEDPRLELEGLAAIPEFRDYTNVLDRHIQLFKSRAMAADELKAAIEGLATHFLRALLSALRTPQGKNILSEYLGIREEQPPETHPDLVLAEGGKHFEETDFLEAHFHRIVEEQFAALRKGGRRALSRRLEGLRAAFAAVREAAMIHGDEEIEVLCFKAAELLRRASLGQVPRSYALELAERVQEVVIHLPAANQRNGELRLLASELQDALNGQVPPERIPPEPAAPVFPGEDRPLGEPAGSGRPTQEEPSAPLPSWQGGAIGQEEATPHDELEVDFTGFVGIEDFLELESGEEDAPPETEATGELDTDVIGQWAKGDREGEPPFKLPGEDDEELRALIQEVRSHSWKVRRGPEPENEPEATAWQPTVSKAPHWSEEASKPPVPAPYGDFQGDASLYLGVLEGALAVLRADRGAASALEDIGLAARSLKALLQKLRDERLWPLASTLASAADRALHQKRPVDDFFIRAAETARRILAAGPTQTLDGELHAVVSELAQWPAVRPAHRGETEAGMNPGETRGPETGMRSAFRLRGSDGRED